MDGLSLYDLQRHFTECLLDKDISASMLPLKPALDEKDQRLNIYRNNVFHSLSSALAELYPVVKQLVGEAFFKASARSYLQQFPPRSPAMVNFGANFPEFLQEFIPAQGLVFLADVARVELAWHESYHAMDAKPLDPETLMHFAPEQLAHARFVIHPSVRLIRSPYPVYTIWNAHQGVEIPQKTISLEDGPESICIYRPEYEVFVKPLEQGRFLMLDLLRCGKTLEQALDTVLNHVSEFNAEQALANSLRDGLFQDIKEETL